MWQQIIMWIRNLFGRITGTITKKELAAAGDNRAAYEDSSRVNFTAVFSNALANKSLADSTVTISGESGNDNKRSEFIRDSLAYVWRKGKKLVDMALGTGGVFLIPYVVDDRVFVAVADQSMCVVSETNGADEIVTIDVQCDAVAIGENEYRRVMDFALANGVLTIQNKAVRKNGEEVPLETVEAWADIEKEIHIPGVNRMPIAYLRCPKSDRKLNSVYGVPITYGAEDTIRQLGECLEQIEQEYKLKRAFVGADETLFGINDTLPEDGLFKTFSPSGELGSRSFWEVVDPAIRDSAYYARYTMLCGQMEKEVGTSKGVLTEPSTAAATATEIKAANKATFDIVSDIRANIEDCFDVLAEAVDIYADTFHLAPPGDYKVTFDWDVSMLESTQETFAQMAELQSRGLISGARLNSWVTGQTVEEAQAEIDSVTEELMKRQAAMMQPAQLEPEE